MTPTYALPDVGAAMAADARVPALTMTGFDGKTTGSLLKMLPFADIVKWCVPWGLTGSIAGARLEGSVNATPSPHPGGAAIFTES